MNLGSGKQKWVAALAAAAISLILAGCSDDAPPDAEPSNDGLTDVTHVLEPTDQMREVAEQQCLDDPDLAEGYVRAVSPDTEEVMAEIAVDCAEVRAAE